VICIYAFAAGVADCKLESTYSRSLLTAAGHNSIRPHRPRCSRARHAPGTARLETVQTSPSVACTAWSRTSSGLPGVEDQMQFGRLVRCHLGGSFEDLCVPADDGPPMSRDIGEPDLIRGAFGGLTTAVQLSGGVHHISEIPQAPGDGPTCDVLIEVELRRRGPGGRGRRPGRRRRRSRTLPRRHERPLPP
jgi:hypothetical protein